MLSKAVDWLTAGFEFTAPYGVKGMRVPSVFFADDGAFCTDNFETLQTVFYVVSMIADLEGAFRRFALDRTSRLPMSDLAIVM